MMVRRLWSVFAIATIAMLAMLMLIVGDASAQGVEYDFTNLNDITVTAPYPTYGQYYISNGYFVIHKTNSNLYSVSLDFPKQYDNNDVHLTLLFDISDYTAGIYQDSLKLQLTNATDSDLRYLVDLDIDHESFKVQAFDASNNQIGNYVWTYAPVSLHSGTHRVELIKNSTGLYGVLDGTILTHTSGAEMWRIPNIGQYIPRIYLNLETTDASVVVRYDYFTVNTLHYDNVVGFAQSSYSVAEGGLVNLTVTRGSPSPSNVSVNYTTIQGTATADTDFISTSGVLSFAPGEVSKNITIGALSDSVYDPGETFTVVLSSPVNCVLGANASTNVAIIDSLAANGFRLVVSDMAPSVWADVTATLIADYDYGYDEIIWTTDEVGTPYVYQLIGGKWYLVDEYGGQIEWTRDGAHNFTASFTTIGEHVIKCYVNDHDVLVAELSQTVSVGMKPGSSLLHVRCYDPVEKTILPGVSVTVQDLQAGTSATQTFDGTEITFPVTMYHTARVTATLTGYLTWTQNVSIELENQTLWIDMYRSSIPGDGVMVNFKIIAAGSHNVIPGAVVTIPSTGQSAVTNEYGVASIQLVNGQTYYAKCSRQGYWSVGVNFTAEVNLVVPVVLYPGGGPSAEPDPGTIGPTIPPSGPLTPGQEDAIISETKGDILRFMRGFVSLCLMAALIGVIQLMTPRKGRR